MEYHSEIKRHDRPETDTQNNMMALKCIRLSKRSQTKKLRNFIYMTFSKGRTIGTEKRSVVARGWGWRKGMITEGQHKRMVFG